MTDSSRHTVARLAADQFEAFVRTSGGDHPVLVGFDGFIDSIIHLVARRASMDAGDYERIATIPEFAARVGAAGGKSANIEMVVQERRFGGNGPLMAGALGRLGLPVTYIGGVRADDGSPLVHPVFEAFGERCALVIPVAPPAETDALEFDDGKIMLGKPANAQQVTWERIKAVVGLDELIAIVERSSLIGIVNWVLCGGVEGIWRGLIDEVLPKVTGSRARRVYIDLSDPAKRSDGDIASALALLGELNGLVPVTLGLNLAESQRIARVGGAEPFDESHNLPLGRAVRGAAESIRAALGLDTVVVHPRQGAAAADARGHSAWFDGPFTSKPRLSTGAGDHFNAGFAGGQIAGLRLEACLGVGCAVSGAYVRDAMSPDLARLVGFLRDLPGGE